MYGVVGSSIGFASMVILAAAGELDPTSRLFDVGIIGVVLVLVISGRFLVPRYSLDKAEAAAALWQAEAVKWQDETQRLNKAAQEATIPALIKFNDATTEVLDMMKVVFERGER